MTRLFPALALALALAGCPAGVESPPPFRPPYDEPAPPGAVAIVPALPQMIRNFALSADRQRVAFTEEGAQPWTLRVATLGGDMQDLGPLPPGADGPLQWTSDAQAVIYVVEGTQDAGPERRERIMRQPLAGGAPQLLLTVGWPAIMRVSPTRAELYYLGPGEVNRAVRRLDLATGADTELLQPAEVQGLTVAPDGTWLSAAVMRREPVPGLASQIVDPATGAVLSSEKQALFKLPVGVTPEPDGPRLRVWRPPSPEPTILTLTGGHDARRLQFEHVSPDGRRIAAYANNTNLVIDLGTGAVQALPSFGYMRAWLDDRTLMITYHGGQFAVTVPD